MTAAPDALAESRRDHLDRAHATAGHYRRIDAGAKTRAHAAFLAYEGAVRVGDHEHALAARERFMTASKALGGRRGAK